MYKDRGNLGFLLFKDYYIDKNRKFKFRNIDEIANYNPSKDDFFEEKNKEIFARKADNNNQDKDYKNYINSKHHLYLRTTYPGLIIGLGYDIGIGVEEEFKNGFFFDWTTGLPVIPGSSVKGVLSSAFPMYEEELDKFNLEEEYNKERKEYLNQLGEKEYSIKEWLLLRDSIFEGLNQEGEPKPFSKRDIFFGGEVSSAPQKLMAEDYITPHKDPLKNPEPIKILKVVAGVVFRVDFDLKDSELLSAKEKLTIFKDIILDFGLGAKTNSGYGHFQRKYTEKEFKKITNDCLN